MSVVIEITSTHVDVRNGTSQRTGKPYSIYEQQAYMHTGEPYPVRIKINLESGQNAYQPGNYDLHPSSFFADRFGSMSVRPVLVPRPAEQRQQPQRPASAS